MKDEESEAVEAQRALLRALCWLRHCIYEMSGKDERPHSWASVTSYGHVAMLV
jgi:hypothetical protein